MRWTPRISASDRPAASTVGCCWRSCAWCCRLSRCACSLASAGNVCWAKPNHGFFNCQHPVAIIFRDTRMALVNDALAQQRRRPHLTHAQPRASPCANASMHARAKYAAFSAHLRDAVPSLSLRTNRSRAKRCLCALHKPVCAKLREHFRASKAIDAPPSRFSLPRKTKDPRRFHRGSRHGVRLDARVSGLRLPAAPRRRPGRATR